MPNLCPHGLPAADCLICPTLPGRPQVVTGVPAPRHGRGAGLYLVVGVVALAAAGAAAWLFVSVVFTVLHLLQLVAAAAVAGWIGYRVGHFRGSRRR